MHCVHPRPEMRKGEETEAGESCISIFPSIPFEYFIASRYLFHLKIKILNTMYKENSMFSLFSQ